MTVTFGSLFAGIGGFDLGFERVGMIPLWQVEINDFCNKVLAKHWPDVARYKNVREVGQHNLEPVDLICGGFPCQPFSSAGKRRGAEDDRNLWPEFKRVIDELKPRWVVAENVIRIREIYLDTVLSDLEGLGYATATAVIPACAVDAPHRRDRVWIVAYSDTTRLEIGQVKSGDNEAQQQTIERGRDKNVPNPGRTRLPLPQQEEVSGSRRRDKGRATTEHDGRPAESVVGVLADGLSSGLAGCGWLPEPGIRRTAKRIPNRVGKLKALGNAVVPQVVEVIGNLIVEVETVIEEQ